MSRGVALLPLLVFGSPRLTSRVRLRRAYPCRSDSQSGTATESPHLNAIARRHAGEALDSPPLDFIRAAQEVSSSRRATWEERFTCFEKH
jgi:hypothetical protein